MSVERLPHWVSGVENGDRLESRLLEERIQEAVAAGERFLKIEAFGQHGIGGRLWSAGEEALNLKIYGSVGQRVGSMGFANTRIEVMGPASDDVGWLNAGAEIIVHGHASNGLANAMARGRIYVNGNIGARGMTMTKGNPRFEPPEVWVLGSVGDYFAEFMAGGTAVVCGVEAQDSGNILGHRPCVGMVGGRIFFRGPIEGFSTADARQEDISDRDWEWLMDGLPGFLAAIDRTGLAKELGRREQWRQLVAVRPGEKTGPERMPMAAFRFRVWDAELGTGGLIGDLTTVDRTPIGLVVSGEMRRWVPVWENNTHRPPCQAACPTGIPVQERWSLIREGRTDEAVELALNYTPFPATVCGYLCPNLCMAACTRTQGRLPGLDLAGLGRLSVAAGDPVLPEPDGVSVAVIGGGPAGMSTAWQLRRLGHKVTVFDRAARMGGKISASIPASRIPDEVLTAELARAERVLDRVELGRDMTTGDFNRLRLDHHAVVVAVGATRARLLPVPGKKHMTPALDFLKKAKTGPRPPKVGKKVVVIGAGNVGCDAAAEAARLRAEDILLIDIQQPAAFGREREEAEAAGARFRWPVVTERVTKEGVVLEGGEVLPAETVIVAVGDAPELDFLPEEVAVERGFIKADASGLTSAPDVYAVGDAVRPGLLTEAIGSGLAAARAMDARSRNLPLPGPAPAGLDYGRVSLEYFDPQPAAFEEVSDSAAACSSCGVCRDCGTCVEICPQGAISRNEGGNGVFGYVVDEDRCIGCGFCAGACPCGVWLLTPAEPLD